MKTISLTQGMSTTVDDNIYDWLSQSQWFAQKGGRELFYACRNSKTDSKGKRRQIRMHHEVLHFNGIEIPDSFKVDHIDRNGLNNTLENLRVVTHQENVFNQRRCSNKTSSQFKGCFRYVNNRFKAQVNTTFLERQGYFPTEYEAAKAYDSWIYSVAGDKACLNFPDESIWTEEEVSRAQCNRDAKSGYRGVTVNTNNSKKTYWMARIYHDGKTLVLGCMYETPEEAALAYNEAAIRLKGSKAKLNIIP
jgi:hypothetical protein